MKRAVGLALLGMLLLAGVQPVLGQLISFNGGDKKHAPGSRSNPLPVGPWYAYWPLESHFQVPGVPAYPMYSSPMTLPVTPPSPYALGGNPNPGGYPGGGMPYPSMPPANGAMGGANPSAGGSPYAGNMGYGMPYGGMPYGAPQMPVGYPGMPYPGMTPNPASLPFSPGGQPPTPER